MSSLVLLMLDTALPRLPGAAGHRASWAMPVRAVVAPGALPQRVVRDGDATLPAPFIALRAPQTTSLVPERTCRPPFAAALQQAAGLRVQHLMTLVYERWSGL